VDGIARALAELARTLKRYFGPRLSPFEIARRKREAEARQAEAAAAEIRQARQYLEDFIEEQRRRRQDEEDEEEEERRRRRRGTVTAWRGVAAIAAPGRARLALEAPFRPTMRRAKRNAQRRAG
jgi:hypothetical protein